MKTNELMIGDWVNIYAFPNDNPQGDALFHAMVNSILEGEHVECKFWLNEGTKDKYGYASRPANTCLPIPITPEILEKNFEKKTFYGIYDDYFDLDIREYTDSLYIVTYHSCEFNIPDQAIHISWVHELQHFLNHCGISKEIVL